MAIDIKLNEIEFPQNFVGIEIPKKDSPKVVRGSTYEKSTGGSSKAYIMFDEWQEVSYEEMKIQVLFNELYHLTNFLERIE